jgi:TRAP transporter 4TM/12TM fusion protein
MNAQGAFFIRHLARGVELALWLIGLALVTFIGLGVFGLVSHGPGYYVTFVLGIIVMAGLLALIELAEVTEAAIDPGDHTTARPISPRWAAFKAIVTLTAMISGVVGVGYYWLNVEHLMLNAPFFGETAINMGYLIIYSIIALTWLHWGWLLASLSAASIAYFFFGDMIPIALLRHPGYGEAFIMNYVALNTNQGFFMFSGVAADDIFLLTYFGVALLGVGMLRMMIEVGRAAGTRVRGGAAVPAILGSSAIGSVMGQAVSNVVLTGRLTIPMMKRYRYDPAMAGAIEATASSVGQLMPPVLGLAGFIIASFLGMPYATVALAAVIPAVLYISGATMSIAVYAMRENLPRLHETVETPLIWRMLPTLVISLGLVIWLLLGFRSPGFAALVGIISALVLALFQGPYRPRWADLRSALREGMVLTTILSLLILAIGPLGQVMVTTNLSGRMATVLATVLPDAQLLLLCGAMVLSIFLGMGLPTPIAYVVASLAVVPFLQETGVPAFQAHFFVFYFAVFSTLTPPIAVSVLAAAKLAGASFRDTALNAMKIAGTTFIIPFAFIYNPRLLGFPNVDSSVIMPIIEVLATQAVVAIAAYGYCFKRLGMTERWAFALVALIGYWTLTTYERPVMRDIVLISSILSLVIWCWTSARYSRARAGAGEAN